MSVSIQLTRGYVARIDARDAHLAELSWCAEVRRNGRVYAARQEAGRKVYLHRAVMGVTGYALKVDHQDGNTLDCRRQNLVIRTNAENVSNHANHLAGTYWHKSAGKWAAIFQGKHLGLFAERSAALRARLVREKEVLGVLPRRRAAFEEAGLC